MRLLFIVVTLACCMPFYGTAQQKEIRIHFKLPYLQHHDSIRVVVKRYDEEILPFAKVYHITDSNNEFNARIPVDLPVQYVCFQYPADSLHKWLRVSNYYMCQGGEDVEVSGDNGQLHFTGKGAVTMNLEEEFAELERNWNHQFGYDYKFSERFFDTSSIRNNFRSLDSLANEQLTLLRSSKEKLTDRESYMLYVDILSMNQAMKWMNFPGPDDPRNKVLREGLKGYADTFAERLVAPDVKMNSDAIYSFVYFDAIFNKYRFDLFNNDYKQFKTRPVYDRIKKSFSGALQQKLLTCLLYRERNKSDDTSNMTGELISQSTLPELKTLLADLQTSQRGAAAYNFALEDTTGKVWHLTDFRGKVVVIDFWYNGCGACRLLYPSMKKMEEKYKNNHRVVFMSMILPSPRKVWLDGINGGHYTSTDVLNLWLNPKDGKSEAHPVIHNYHVGGYPTLVMIDPKGKMMVSPERPDFDGGVDMEAKIKAGLGSM